MGSNTDESISHPRSVPEEIDPMGVVPSLEASPRFVSIFSSLSQFWLMSPVENLDSELDRRDGGVLNVIPPLVASRLEIRLGVPRCFPSVLAFVQG